MRKLSKSEFMKLYINDMYKKKWKERSSQGQADRHIFNNIDKIHKRTSGKAPIRHMG